jgi:hypothetical protein
MRFVALFSHHTGIVGQLVFPQYVTFMVSAFRLGSLFEGNIYCVGMSLPSVLDIYSCKVIQMLREYYKTKEGFHLFISGFAHGFDCGLMSTYSQYCR